jgi:ParB family chromosome partitioning protein
MSEIVKIPINDVEASLFECREGSDLTELTLSIEKVGVMEPIIIRPKPDGKYELVAGGRRVIASKAAGLKDVPAIVRELSDEEAFIFQVSENLQRVDLTDKEKTKLVVYCAEKYKWKPKEIAEKISMSIQWVYKYLPNEYKDQVKAEAGRVGAEAVQEKKAVLLHGVEQTVTIQDVPKVELVECEICHMGISASEAQTIEGHVVCPSHVEVAKRQYASTPKQTPKEYKPKDSWEYRRAQMSPQHSRMEEIILAKLHEKDMPVVVDQEFCIQSTIPDFYFPSRNLAVYLDGPVHRGREDRDEQLRESLTARYGLRVVSIPYDGSSQQEVDRVLEQIIKEA